MQKIIRAYEQYCWVVKHNVIVEESYHYGKERVLRCMNEKCCDQLGGCKNRYVLGREVEQR